VQLIRDQESQHLPSPNYIQYNFRVTELLRNQSHAREHKHMPLPIQVRAERQIKKPFVLWLEIGFNITQL